MCVETKAPFAEGTSPRGAQEGRSLGGHPEVSEAGMRARGKVEMEGLLVFIPISLWEGANPSHGCEMRVMGGGGLEVSHPP